MQYKTAVLFGATGLIGSYLLKELLADKRYSKITVFVRRTTGILNERLQEIITDFKDLDALRKDIKGDDLFCCLGTTIRKAGSQEEFRHIDFELVNWIARSGSENGVKQFLVVSSMGANAKSGNFYLRTKGEMEKAVAVLGFEKCIILRPSMLLGFRNEQRIGEGIGKFLMQLFRFVLPPRWKAIEAKTVAHAMLKAANNPSIDGVMNLLHLMGHQVKVD